ncbi:hypothetical protein E4O00_02110 [Treponema sp. OMZ 788]|uniref:hypothetical protein n=1 Tax=Treponema sp. OMZ 788 TaxID=2563664 RepID=UPI0020A45D77|nr:hypothetical protein [Treponema sp. OMZ 788]UTC65017.1 hypothetical protein E4O00_02110 [Treponema sp. OMZ 788]
MITVHHVKPEHLTSGTLTISYTTKGAATGSIKFENPMTCIKNNQHGNGTSITSGDQVQEGDRLDFYVNLPQGKVVGKWMVNGTQISNGSGGEYHQLWLTVQAKHFKDNILNISYTLIPAAQTKVNFDGNIRCSVNRNGTNIDVESDKTIVYEGESLDFKALGMPDSAVKGWKINDKKPQGWNGQENTRFNVTVMKFYISESSGGPIMVSCELKEGLKSAALDFDSGKIKCRQQYGDEFNSGLRVYADVRLEFNALLSGLEEVKSWKINGIEQENSGHKNFSYMVQESDLNGDNFTVEIVLK